MMTSQPMPNPEKVPTLDRACELLWQAGHPAIAEALDAEVRALAVRATKFEAIIYPEALNRKQRRATQHGQGLSAQLDDTVRRGG